MKRSIFIGRIAIILSITLVLAFIATLMVKRGNHDSSPDKQRLILIQGRVLNAFYKANYMEIKRANLFYGYGWIDRSKVFVAYQPEDSAEAFAEIEIIDVDTLKHTEITTIGGTGESNFEVNNETKAIVFNDTDGIKLLTIENNAFQIDKLKTDANTWGVFWIDNKTIGYIHYEDDKEEFRKIVIEGKGLKE